MKKLKKIFWGLLAMAFVAAGYGFYLFNKKPADVRELHAQFEITAATLVTEFNTDETAANKKYLDKVIAVKGNVTEVKKDANGQVSVFLDTGDPMAAVTCSFYSEEAGSVTNLTQGKEVTIKGMCTGKLMDVVINRCSINK
jgi:tRNA_anti-like